MSRIFRTIGIAGIGALGSRAFAQADVPARRASVAPAIAAPSRETLASRGAFLWVRRASVFVYPKPRSTELWIGSLHEGTPVALRAQAPRRGAGCRADWLPIEPRGWVCGDDRVTQSSDERRIAAVSWARSGELQYALSSGAPMYRRLPTRQEWMRSEAWLGAPGTHAPMSWGNRGHEALAESRAITVNAASPDWFREQGSLFATREPGLLERIIPNGSMLGYVKVLEHEGRVFVVEVDGTLVPAERLRPFRRSEFAGVELNATRSLPLAWTHLAGCPVFEGSELPLRETATRIAGLTLHQVTSERRDPKSGRSFWRLVSAEQPRPNKPGGDAAVGAHWLEAACLSVAQAAPRMPGKLESTEVWLDIAIRQGTLVAYRGSEPIFATAVSPGAGGVPRPGGNLVKDSTTPTGSFRLEHKLAATTMSPEPLVEQRDFWIAEVPATQYFSAPFALHVAYWHENFGQPKSAGCVNLSPRDGATLFALTSPSLPAGWHSVVGGPGASRVLVHP